MADEKDVIDLQPAAYDGADVKSIDSDAQRLAGMLSSLSFGRLRRVLYAVFKASPPHIFFFIRRRLLTCCIAEMGYTQDMRRNFSVWSVLAVGFSVTNSWFGISAALVTGINSGGPILIVYGIILIALISTCVGISLSELS